MWEALLTAKEGKDGSQWWRVTPRADMQDLVPRRNHKHERDCMCGQLEGLPPTSRLGHDEFDGGVANRKRVTRKFCLERIATMKVF